MFEQASLPSGPAAKRILTTCLGFTGQATVVVAMILAPMIWPDVLPQARAYVTILGPPVAPPPPPPPGVPAVRPRDVASGARPALPWQPLQQPTSVPKGTVELVDAPEVAYSVGRGPVGAGSAVGDFDGVIGGIGPVTGRALPPPPPEPPKPRVVELTQRVIQTSQLDPARLIHRVDPVYPALAKQARVQGTVELRGVVGTDGRMRELKVLSGHPLLVKAAVDAVSQWVYKPTFLSGKPVEVDAPIIVTFRLN